MDNANAAIAVIRANADSVTGFLPTVTPLQQLPAPYTSIVQACIDLPGHYHGEGKNCRPWLNSLFDVPDPKWFSQGAMLDRPILEALMTKVTLLCHAFRWQSMPTDPANYQLKSIDLPKGLNRLWGELAATLGIPRVGIFYTMIGNNWRLTSKGGGERYDPHSMESEDIELIHPWLNLPEAEDLRTFVVTALGIESKGAAVLQQIVRILTAIERDRPHELTYNLMIFEGVLLSVLAHFNTHIKKTRLKPGNFLRLVQPTMVWLLDHGDGPLEGASGPQSCTIQCIDSFLGIPRTTELGSVIIQSRKYMLPRHRELVETLDAVGPSLRTYINDTKNPRLIEVYNRCVEVMLSWRRSHQKRGGMYIQGEDEDRGQPYVSTGLVITLGENQQQRYDAMMESRIGETRAQLLEDKWGQERSSFAFLFRYLDEGQRATLTQKTRHAGYDAGEYIIRKNDRFPGLYMLLEGSVVVSNEVDGKSVRLAQIPCGEVFGEMSLVENLPASADVQAETNVRVSFLPVEELYQLIADNPRTEAALYLALAQVLSRRLRTVSAGPQ